MSNNLHNEIIIYVLLSPKFPRRYASYLENFVLLLASLGGKVNHLALILVTERGCLVTDGDAIKLPDNLESLPKADHFPTQRHRWNTNEVSYSYLTI